MADAKNKKTKAAETDNTPPEHLMPPEEQQPATDPIPAEGEDTQVEVPEKSHAKQPTRLTEAAHAVMTWHHTADAGDTPESLTHPQTWAHVARQLQPGHEIIIGAFDATWRLHLYCRAVGRTEVHVGVVNFTEFGGQVQASDNDPYGVAFRGPHKWSVISRETKAIIKDQFPTQEAAQGWIDQHMKAMAA